MASLELSREQRLGLHAVQTAASLSYLTEAAEWLPFLTNLIKCVHFINENWLCQDALLNEEPIYIAGRMLSLREEDIDNLPDQKWLGYSNMLTFFSTPNLHEYATEMFGKLGSGPSIRSTRIDITIFDLNMDSSARGKE